MGTATTSPEALTTGWEPGAPIGDTLLRRFVFVHAERLAAIARASGRPCDATADARFADPDSPGAFDRAVVLVRPPSEVDLDDVVARALAFYGPGRDWVLMSVWPTADLVPLGLRLVGHPPLMFRLPAPLPPPPPELVVREVEGSTRLAHFESTLVDGYPLPRHSTRVPGLDPRVMDGADHRFVGYIDGAPVSVAGAGVGHGLLEVDWVATLPAARRRGYGAALTAAALGVAPDLPAVLVASDPGRPVYHRLGFVDLLRVTLWEVQR